jgi:hypothetical protein
VGGSAKNGEMDKIVNSDSGVSEPVKGPGATSERREGTCTVGAKFAVIVLIP